MASAAKMFFETHYNILTSSELTPRSLRRRQLEYTLYEDTISSPADKEERRRNWAKHETDHLRETRVMKARSSNGMRGQDFTSSKYEVVKVI